MRERDDAIVERFLADLPDLYPHTRGVIAGATVYYNLPSASGVTLTAAQYRELPVTCLQDTGGHAVAATELIQTGDTTGPVRAPLLPLDDAATGELAALLDHATLAGSAR